MRCRTIANRQDGNGEYLFSGYSTQTQPFAGGDGTPINYVADQGARQLQISSTQRIADSHNGYEVLRKHSRRQWHVLDRR